MDSRTSGDEHTVSMMRTVEYTSAKGGVMCERWACSCGGWKFQKAPKHDCYHIVKVKGVLAIAAGSAITPRVVDQTTFRQYAGRIEKCEHAIRIPDNDRAYEIGVTRHGDSRQGFVLSWDSWAGGYGMVEKVGEEGARLKMEYGIAVDMKIKQDEGYEVVRENMADGRVVVTARSWS